MLKATKTYESEAQAIRYLQLVGLIDSSKDFTNVKGELNMDKIWDVVI